MTTDLNFVCCVKEGEHYVICWDDDHTNDAMRQLGKWASSPELSFTWYDAATTSQQIRQRANDSKDNH